MLAIRDRMFDLSSATFGAILSLDEDAGWRFQWSFEFDSIAREIDGQSWEPRLYADALKLTLPAPVSLPGHTFPVPDVYNVDDEPNFTLYVFEHEPAYDIQVAFGPWRGESIELTLSGKADVNWDDDYGTSLPIRVACTTVFEGINVWDRAEESARARLAAFYDPSAFTVEKSRIGFNYRLR
jgi:hypothetical protein